MEKYPRGRRGSPAKGVVRDTVARVQIPLSPPSQSSAFCIKNERLDCRSFFYSFLPSLCYIFEIVTPKYGRSFPRYSVVHCTPYMISFFQRLYDKNFIISL